MSPARRPMTRYVAFLRGVSPMNAQMAELTRAFEAAGFTDVRTRRSSGNVLFSARRSTGAALQRKAEAAMKARLGSGFLTFVREVDPLRALLDSDPYRSFRLPRGAKRVVTFLREEADPRLELPISLGGARILCAKGREVFSAYVPGPRGPVFMALIEKTFGAEVTTRTWETVRKVAG